MKHTLNLKMGLSVVASAMGLCNPLATAAVSIPSGGVTVNFAALPAAADFTTVSVGTAGTVITALGTAAAGIDNPTTGVSATLAYPATPVQLTVLAAVPTAQSNSAAVRHITAGQNALTGPTGNAFSALVGRFQNSTAGPIANFNLAWTLGVPVAPGGTGAVGTDPVAGIHVYYSTTGALGSWVRVGTPPHATAGPVAAVTITPATPIAVGGDLYIAWVDDNGPASTTAPDLEGNFTIDDVVISVGGSSINATVSNIVRNENGTPNDATDDKINFTLTVMGSGAVSSTWTTSGAFANSGAYGTPKNFTGIPIAEFMAAPHSVTVNVADTIDAAINTDVVVQAPGGSITVVGSAFTRTMGVDPADATDDEFTCNLSANGQYLNNQWASSGAVTQVPPTGFYNFPTAVDPMQADVLLGPVTFTDSVDATITADAYLLPPFIIGQTNLGFTSDVVSTGKATTGAASQVTWTNDPTSRTLEMADGDRNGAGITAKEIDAVVNLAGVAGPVRFSMQLVATDGSSGFEAGDTFAAELILNDGVANLPPVSVLKPTQDTNNNGILAGTELALANTVNTFGFDAIIPDNIQSARLVIRAICDSAPISEKMVVQNILFESAPPELRASAGTATIDNRGTIIPSDDLLSAPVTISPINLSPSTGWQSVSLTAPEGPLSGLYSAANPVTFLVNGPVAPATTSTFTIRDALAPTKTASVIVTPPAKTLTATLVAGSIVRNANGAGDADDTVTFSLNVASTNAGPSFTAATSLVPSVIAPGTTAYPAAGVPVTITMSNLPRLATTTNVIIADASYPTAPAPISIAIAIPAATAPGPYVIGQKNFGAGLSDVVSAAAPPAAWNNYPATRETVMITGGATDVILESEAVDLATVGAVEFTATLRARDSSTTSNFETADRFKAELVVDGATIIPLITAAMDVGNGAPATVTPGDNGAPNSYLNGYTGTAATQFLAPMTVYATAGADYNDNRVRDELNPLGLDVAAQLNATITMTASVPASANSVMLRVIGTGIAGSESFTVENVLFTLGTAPLDTDMDGMTDEYEDANGLLKNDPADAGLDKDLDGQTNLNEFLAGTAANDPNSTLKISTIAKGTAAGTYDLTIVSVSGKRYKIQESTDLGRADTWTDVVPAATVTASGPATVFTVPAAAASGARHYFRAVLVP